jgi:tetratricopeptide (TPR) repeat protein
MDASHLTPSQIAETGKQHYQQEDFAQAAELFALAADGFTAAGEPLQAAEMANNRSVALLQGGEARAALDAVGATDEVFSAAGDTRRQAMALGNRAAALAGLGQNDEAERVYWQSAQLLGELGERDLRASVLQAISKLQLKGGRYGEALASMDSGLEGVERLSLSRRILRKLIRIPMKMLGRDT